MPLLWFGLFAEARRSMRRPAARPPRRHDRAADPPHRTRGVPGAFARVQAAIAAGDIYQANLTFPGQLRVAGSPLALYARLRAQGGGGWGGVVHDGARWLLSCSPELFFTLDGDALTARPMKGTAAREADPAADLAAAEQLLADPKQRAENLMIVDLLRNDLARVAVAGSVAVPALFTVERYPTVHQLTSTVTATLAPDEDAASVGRRHLPLRLGDRRAEDPRDGDHRRGRVRPRDIYNRRDRAD
jgi:para-aminobenzoate synthetase/4-amino-4-deoxychorismate lyase